MIFRMLAGVGLLALGYYIGKEVGRTEHIREDLEKARDEKPEDEIPTTKTEGN